MKWIAASVAITAAVVGWQWKIAKAAFQHGAGTLPAEKNEPLDET